MSSTAAPRTRSATYQTAYPLFPQCSMYVCSRATHEVRALSFRSQPTLCDEKAQDRPKR
ncbi:hypothetical protein VFPFJ_06447 [Purpureocillium lilacinum]|uniref:Uncharacterized protein n=1 Tax=Purpureocillium lilacinum TaxID=33203 RepID=A0A179HET5_PURLI|nr:hypothetical protein VFPFJ_06447 [Purpureocillium lilacinum]OAQ87979.1 hypothetical protein VFPBJ_02020 [Purpureocillium lilacinum]OAQ90034.1 hypothetical protein VFPFJ_06447 [Purpureocillium lilacinum]